MISLIISGFSLGVLSSLHCIGMCGPIALSLPVHQFSTFKKYLLLLLYNFGRAITYSLFGLLLGSMSSVFAFTKYQQVLSVTAGIIMLLIVVFHFALQKKLPQLTFLNSGLNKLKHTFSALIVRRTWYSMPVIGILNGLLPCGMVYIASAAAVASGSYFNGALFMFAFGLGTIPLMFGISLFGQMISLNFKNLVRRAMPAMLMIFSLLIIARGLNLGIPYISPKTNVLSGSPSCHTNDKVITCLDPENSNH